MERLKSDMELRLRTQYRIEVPAYKVGTVMADLAGRVHQELHGVSKDYHSTPEGQLSVACARVFVALHKQRKILIDVIGVNEPIGKTYVTLDYNGSDRLRYFRDIS
jgi:hypothetical protein